jgi:predicted permease
MPDIEDLGRAASLQALAAYVRLPLRATFGTQTESVIGESVTANYFRVLDAPFILGRPLTSDDENSAAPVAVISERLWRRHFGANADIVGHPIRVGGRDATIVGIASRHLRGDHNLNWYPAPDIWIPVSAVSALTELRWDKHLRNRAMPIFVGLGRLRPGVPITSAEAELSRIFGNARPAGRAALNHIIRIFPAAESKFYPGYRAAFARNLSAFGIATILILLLAAANVANLLVERTTRRQREMAIRTALGAGRGRVVRQLFVEGLVLAAPGFLLSILVAAGLQRVLTTFPTALGVELYLDLEITGRVLAYGSGVSILLARAVSVIPAMRSGRAGVGPLLKNTAAGPPRRRSWISQSLAVVQVGLAAILLVGSFVIARGFWIAHEMPLGFDPAPVVVLSVDRFSAAGDRPLPPAILERSAWLPAGVTDVVLTSVSPFAGLAEVTDVRDAAAANAPPVSVDRYFVSGSFFETLRIPLLSGRVFENGELAAAQTVIVNDALARRLWDGQPVLGRTIRIGAQTATIVGVVGNTRYRDVWDSDRLQLYRPFGPNFLQARTIIARAAGSPDRIVPAVERAWTAFAPTVPIEEVLTGASLKARALDPMRLMSALVGVFTLVAIGIAGVGLYSTIAWLVEQRSREIAVRIAIGGLPSRIGVGVIGRALVLTLAGSAIGFATAVKVVPRVSDLTHGLASPDSWAITASAVVLSGVSIVAAVIPARRAVRIDPIVILKSE